MPVVLYYFPESGPCRAVLMAANLLGVDLEAKRIRHNFLKMNPQHTLPTMDDEGFYLNESRAMLQYLANTYGQDGGNDHLYPREPKARAKVDMRLYFDLELWNKFLGAYILPFLGNNLVPCHSSFKKLEEALHSAETYLQEGGGYIAGGFSMTIADISLIATLSTVEAVGHDLHKFPKVEEYITRIKEEIQDYHKINDEGVEKCRLAFRRLRENVQTAAFQNTQEESTRL